MRRGASADTTRRETPVEEKMDRTRILFIIWFAVLVTMWTNRPGPTVLTAEMQAAVTAR